jgi:hypothetical protein
MPQSSIQHPADHPAAQTTRGSHSHATPAHPWAHPAGIAHRAGTRRGSFHRAAATRQGPPSRREPRPTGLRTPVQCCSGCSWPMPACRHLPRATCHRQQPRPERPAKQANRLLRGLQFRRPRLLLFGVLRLFADTQPPRLGAGAGPRDEPTEGQGGHWRVAQPHCDHRCPPGQDGGAVDATWSLMDPPRANAWRGPSKSCAARFRNPMCAATSTGPPAWYCRMLATAMSWPPRLKLVPRSC